MTSLVLVRPPAFCVQQEDGFQNFGSTLDFTIMAACVRQVLQSTSNVLAKTYTKGCFINFGSYICVMSE